MGNPDALRLGSAMHLSSFLTEVLLPHDIIEAVMSSDTLHAASILDAMSLAAHLTQQQFLAGVRDHPFFTPELPPEMACCCAALSSPPACAVLERLRGSASPLLQAFDALLHALKEAAGGLQRHALLLTCLVPALQALSSAASPPDLLAAIPGVWLRLGVIARLQGRRFAPRLLPLAQACGRALVAASVGLAPEGEAGLREQVEACAAWAREGAAHFPRGGPLALAASLQPVEEHATRCGQRLRVAACVAQYEGLEEALAPFLHGRASGLELLRRIIAGLAAALQPAQGAAVRPWPEAYRGVDAAVGELDRRLAALGVAPKPCYLPAQLSLLAACAQRAQQGCPLMSALDHEVQQWHARLEDEVHALLLGATRSPDSSRARWPGLGPRLCAVRAAQTRVEILWRAWRRVRRRLDGPRGMAAAARSGAAVEAALAALRLAASGLVDEWARQLERQLPGLQQDLQGSVLQRVPATGVLQPGLGPDSRRLIAEAAGLVVIEAPIAIITEVRVAVPGALEGLRAVRGALHAVHAARREAAPFPAACRRAAAALDRRLLAGVGALRWSSPAHQRAFWLRDVADLAAALGAAASAARAMRGAGEPAWGSLARMGFLPTGRDPYSQEDLQRHIDRLQECIEDGTRAVQDALSQHAGSDPDMEGLAQEANLAYCGVVEGMVDRACAAIAAERLAPKGGETVRDGRGRMTLSYGAVQGSQNRFEGTI
ncbi:hypothetical protein F751_1057 [Auxenochlorella protothecoides]|uniref:Uncharacterized protein n=1 Tax=Auxenochlorella protothecoides TaxID=3075 RepID=A0A087SCA7_AUXPR|nr:hypothetical protein F751_1057 [Auxenochlorella protothecoides]KFM23361.1 hypothetical protein F751_1057 [Auxenochlorella protothecoides]